MTTTAESTPGAAGAPRDTVVEARGLGHSYGERRIFRDLSFSVAAGEFVCIVGPSGVGKTTLLQCLTGLLGASEGEVVFEGATVHDPPEGVAIVFQDYSRSLMPWLSVLDNVALPLRSAGVGKAERRRRAEEALAEVGLRDVTDSYPWQLSGGMQQRVAIARALASRPRMTVLDEPFASVDAQTRADLEDLMLRVRDHLGLTIMLVTHDIDEAVYLADTVLVLSGRPAKVETMLSVDLPGPQDQITTKSLPEFAALRSEVYAVIKKAGEKTAAAKAAEAVAAPRS
ncbi:ABC transporter ATP-binding protein [Saccharomonospora glauca]|uniref:ABC-type nitrate/sulfonate/bicarbonate transport system, ATPase component n=1 Tax=Saccharomonospora glauca K62 TaxID=928724 RepID=I1D2V2_9PSEU|nr:ABC transporter ATP-binding protein [Saccharomonospora glauca]EIE99276.1 ABC-type nitrate/sulfonate/bicarbonate transport system, ATPase component [Saccharomonospora glauca K62]